MEEFKNRNTRILIYIDVARMGVNIQDMAHDIQWKISDHLAFTLLLQWISRVERNKTLLTVSIIFIESKYIFLGDIASVRDSPFCDYRTAIRPYDRMQAAKIIPIFYKNNFQNKKSRL